MVDTTQFRIMHNSETEAMRTRFCDEPAEMFRGDAGTERGWT